MEALTHLQGYGMVQKYSLTLRVMVQVSLTLRAMVQVSLTLRVMVQGLWYGTQGLTHPQGYGMGQKDMVWYRSLTLRTMVQVSLILRTMVQVSLTLRMVWDRRTWYGTGLTHPQDRYSPSGLWYRSHSPSGLWYRSHSLRAMVWNTRTHSPSGGSSSPPMMMSHLPPLKMSRQVQEKEPSDSGMHVPPVLTRTRQTGICAWNICCGRPITVIVIGRYTPWH